MNLKKISSRMNIYDQSPNSIILLRCQYFEIVLLFLLFDPIKSLLLWIDAKRKSDKYDFIFKFVDMSATINKKEIHK